MQGRCVAFRFMHVVLELIQQERNAKVECAAEIVICAAGDVVCVMISV